MWLSNYHTLLPERFEIYENIFYIKNILEKLEEFESNGVEYKIFEDFYPEIINYLKTIKINNLREFDKKSLLW